MTSIHEMVSESVVAVSELTRRFGATTALIRHVLGRLRAETGSVRVFGRDPVADLSRIGYLSEENDLPGWMLMAELLRYARAFYPAWDDGYAEELRETFALDPAARIENLSSGQKARAGLLVALAHRPLLLVLDEPTSPPGRRIGHEETAADRPPWSRRWRRMSRDASTRIARATRPSSCTPSGEEEHSWPGGGPLPEWFVGSTSENVDATGEMWSFFRAHPRRQSNSYRTLTNR
jgi:ABC transporter